MNAVENILLLAAAFAYLASSALYGARVLLRNEPLGMLGRFAAMVGVIAHTFAIGVHCSTSHHTPFTTPTQSLSAAAWAVALIYLAMDRIVRPQPVALGAVAQPIAFLCLFASSLGGWDHRAAGVSRALDNPIVSLHVVAIIFSFALLVLAFGCAVLYLAQHRMIKRKQSGTLFGKLPPLATIDRLAFSCVAFAFPLLTIGIAAGALHAINGALGPGWIVDPKILFASATWAVYGVYLILHTLAHWRGPRANYLLIGGVVVAVITIFAPTVAHHF